MSKLNVAKLVSDVKITVTKHSPEILTGIGIAGMLTTTVLAVKATPKALQRIEEVKEVEGKNKLTPMETVKATWKCYIPAAVTAITSTGCLIGASAVNVRRNAALATAYKLSETALSEYKEKVIETIGEKKEKLVHEKIAEDKLEKNPVDESQIILTDKGNTLCFEPISGRYFKSDIDKIKHAVINVNEEMQRSPFGYISLNDLYDELDLEPIDSGDDLGWNLYSGVVRVDFTAKIAKNGDPCIVMRYDNPPVYKYDKF